MASVEKYRDSSGTELFAARWRQDGQQVKKRGFPSRKKAQDYANAQEADAARGLLPVRSDVTVAEYARHWAATRPHRASSKPHVESLIKVRIEGTKLGQRKLAEVRHSEVQLWATRDLAHLSPATRAKTVGYLRSIFRSAERDNLIVKSPVGKIALPEPSEVPSYVPLSAEQVDALADAMPARYRALVLAQAGLGLRIGELLGLRVSDVDFLRRQVRVESQFVGRPPKDEQGRPMRTELKTRYSKRTVPMPQWVADELSWQLAAFGPGEDGSIFTTGRGTPLQAWAYINRWFPRAVEAAGLPKETTTHDLRHHYATELLAAGLSVVEVGRLLGHRDGSLVAKTYGHKPADADDRARKALEDRRKIAV